MAYIGNQPTIGQYRKLDDISGSFNGSLTAFTMQVGSTNVSAGSVFQLLISLGGVIQNPGTDFTLSGSTLTFTTAPTSGLDFFGILMGQPLNTATPGDSTVTGAKIVDGTITGGKLAAGFNYDSGLLFLDDTNNRVGIGTTSPDERLVVSGGCVLVTGFLSSVDRPSSSVMDFLNGATRFFSIGADSSTHGQFVFNTSTTTTVSERARIDTSGRLLVGTSTSGKNSAKLQIAGGDNTNHIELLNTTASDTDGQRYSYVWFRGTQSGGEKSSLAFIGAVHDGSSDDEQGRLIFHTNDGNDGDSPTERLRITSNGTLQLRNSPGIDFSQIQTNAAGMTSETLDSYEEGTWTPVFGDNSGGQATMTVQQGFYTKIGNIVNVWFQIAWSDKGTLGASAVAYFSGFPFSAKSNSSQYYYLGATIKNATTDGVIALAGNGTTAVSQPLNGPSSNQTPSDFSSSGRMMCSMTYFT